MSEPLSTNDIEDVVSSVRRLVSPEARPRPLSRDLGLEKLILTPALLVVPEPSLATERVTKPAPKPKSKSAAPAKTSRKTVAPKADPIRVEPVAPLVEAEWEAPFWTEPEPALAEMALQAEEAVLVTSPEPPAKVTAASVARKPRSASKAKTAAAAKPALSRPKPKAEKPTLRSVKTAPKPRKPAERTAPVAVKPALELVRSEPEVSETAPVSLVPDPAVANPAASPVEPLADLQPGVATAAPSAIEEELVVNGLAQVLTDRDGNPVSLLDEDELILMVRRVIREELQNVLGERITRNIRKLVRSEINRALTSQTLE